MGLTIHYSLKARGSDAQARKLIQDRLPPSTIRQFCIKTAREIASEHRGRFAGVERVTEECEP